MDYYIMCQDDTISDFAEPVGISAVIYKDAVKKGQIQFFDKLPEQFYIKQKSSIQYIDYLDKPVHLVSDAFKQLLEFSFRKTIFFKPIVLADKKMMRQDLYWMIVPEIIDCLSKESEFNKDGTLKKLVIDINKTGCSTFFKIEGIMEDYIILREDVAEKILKEGLVGIKFLKV